MVKAHIRYLAQGIEVFRMCFQGVGNSHKAIALPADLPILRGLNQSRVRHIAGRIQANIIFVEFQRTRPVLA